MKSHLLLPSLFYCKPEIRMEKHYKALPAHRYETKILQRSNCISSYYFPNTKDKSLAQRDLNYQGGCKYEKILWWNRMHDRVQQVNGRQDTPVRSSSVSPSFSVFSEMMCTYCHILLAVLVHVFFT